MILVAQETLTQRVIEVYHALKEAGRVKNKSAFASIVGFPQQYWARFEAGVQKPSLEHAKAISNHFGVPLEYLVAGKGPMFKSTENNFSESLNRIQAPNDAHAVGLLSDIPVIALRRVSFKARASFGYLQIQRYKDSDLFDTVLFRLPPGRTEEDYKDALVFDIEGDSMEPTLQSGQQVIAWPISDGKWEYLHNVVCVVAYSDTVTVKAIFKNDLFNSDSLTLHATGGRGGEFRVAREDIHSVWEVREFYGVVPVRLVP